MSRSAPPSTTWPSRPRCTARHGGEATLSRRDLARASNRYARALAERGVHAGDRVTTSLPNSVELHVATVAVRSSNREPFSPHRMVTAHRAAGFDPDQIALLPTAHDVADTLLRGADLAIAYGGEEVMRRCATATLRLPQGPGRSHVRLTRDVDPLAHPDTLASAVSGHGGTACVNTTAVFVEGDPGPVAGGLAEQLAHLPTLPAQDPRAVLPVQPPGRTRALQRHLLRRAGGNRAWSGAEQVVEELGDGSAALRPAVHQLGRADAEQTRVELPFPCVWVAPWSRVDGLAPLRHTLVLTAVTEDGELVDTLVAEPSIANVCVGNHPTHGRAPGLPHDDSLETFLMRCKTVVRWVAVGGVAGRGAGSPGPPAVAGGRRAVPGKPEHEERGWGACVSASWPRRAGCRPGHCGTTSSGGC